MSWRSEAGLGLTQVAFDVLNKLEAADRLDLSKVAQLIRCVVQLWTLWMLEPIDCARERSSWETE